MKLKNAATACILTGLLILASACGSSGENNLNLAVTNANTQNVNLSAINSTIIANQNSKNENSNIEPANSKKPEKSDKEVSSNGETGVAECDDYIAKYEMCLNTKIPQAQQIMLKPRFEQQRENFKQLAKMPDGKKSLAETCQMITKAIKGATAQYGCEW